MNIIIMSVKPSILFIQQNICDNSSKENYVVKSVVIVIFYVNYMMGKTKVLSADLRQRIINFQQSISSYTTISSRLSIHKSTVK